MSKIPLSPKSDRVSYVTLDAGLNLLNALISEMRADGRLGPFEVPKIRMVNADGTEVTPQTIAAEAAALSGLDDKS